MCVRVCVCVREREGERRRELHTNLHQKGYPTTLINKKFELAKKVPPKELENPKKAQQRNTPSKRRNPQQK